MPDEHRKENESKDEDISYVYTLVREDWKTGEQGKRTKKYYCSQPRLNIGGLYVHLGKGYPGCQRVLSMKEEHYPVMRYERKDSVLEKLNENKKQITEKRESTPSLSADKAVIHNDGERPYQRER